VLSPKLSAPASWPKLTATPVAPTAHVQSDRIGIKLFKPPLSAESVARRQAEVRCDRDANASVAPTDTQTIALPIDSGHVHGAQPSGADFEVFVTQAISDNRETIMVDGLSSVCRSRPIGRARSCGACCIALAQHRARSSPSVDAAGEVVLRRKLRRSEPLEFFRRLLPCLIGIEACASAHYWAREFKALGHTVSLMPARRLHPPWS
jgi:hypothetical protein